ncbi:MAG: Nif3-like dinuclear metal center hexameric protein [Ruminococcaceae bacterium]|nr:Nif3-like dinuclear metal center hexameric protein [Oscillospiraceae bacterium]
MTKISDIYNKIDKIVPFNTAAEFDNAGLLIGSFDTEVKKVLLALDVTNKVMDEALNKGANLIITHHPVIFNPIKKIREEDLVYKLIKSGIAVISAHTNLDLALNYGVNFTLADKLGVKNLINKGEFLFEGEIDPTTLLQFAENIKGITGSDFLEAVLPDDLESYIIEKVGLCSGSGGEFIFETEADAFVTGEMKHHERLFAKEKGIPAFIMGHYESEVIFKEPLRNYLSDEFPCVEFVNSLSESSPTTII